MREPGTCLPNTKKCLFNYTHLPKRAHKYRWRLAQLVGKPPKAFRVEENPVSPSTLDHLVKVQLTFGNLTTALNLFGLSAFSDTFSASTMYPVTYGGMTQFVGLYTSI